MEYYNILPWLLIKYSTNYNNDECVSMTLFTYAWSSTWSAFAYTWKNQGWTVWWITSCHYNQVCIINLFNTPIEITMSFNLSSSEKLFQVSIKVGTTEQGSEEINNIRFADDTVTIIKTFQDFQITNNNNICDLSTDLGRGLKCMQNRLCFLRKRRIKLINRPNLPNYFVNVSKIF